MTETDKAPGGGQVGVGEGSVLGVAMQRPVSETATSASPDDDRVVAGIMRCARSATVENHRVIEQVVRPFTALLQPSEEVRQLLRKEAVGVIPILVTTFLPGVGTGQKDVERTVTDEAEPWPMAQTLQNAHLSTE